VDEQHLLCCERVALGSRADLSRVSGALTFDRLIERYGIDAKLFDWSDEITADCPRKHSENLYDQCGARCLDLPKVV
jgi:hypothetical protein